MSYKCLIVANNIPVVNILTKYINSIDLLKLVDICIDEDQAVEIIGRTEVDVLLIHLNSSQPILMDFLFTKNAPKIIINSSEQHFTIKANDLETINYLMQPNPINGFVKAMTRIRYLNDQDSHTNAFLTSEFIYFRSQRKMIKVILDDIVYVESQKDYVTIHTTKNPPLKIKQGISTLEGVLPPKKFIRIHRSFIVSIYKITAFTHYDVEIDNLELPIGRKYNEVYSRLKSV